MVTMKSRPAASAIRTSWQKPLAKHKGSPVQAFERRTLRKAVRGLAVKKGSSEEELDTAALVLADRIHVTILWRTCLLQSDFVDYVEADAISRTLDPCKRCPVKSHQMPHEVL